MSDQELIQWYKRVFDEYPSVGLLAFIREVMEQATPDKMLAIMRLALEQLDKDWLAMLRAIAKLADKMEAEKAEPDNEWCEVDDATLLEQFDPWQTLREVETALEQAAPVSAWERVPDGQYSVADDDRFNIIVRGQQVQLVTSDLKYLISAINLRDDWKLMRQRPATAAGEEE